MTTYKIVTPSGIACVTTDGGQVAAVSPSFSWLLGTTWQSFRSFIENNGFTIIPVEDNAFHVTWIEDDEASYEFKWIGVKCIRITKHVDGYEPEDLTIDELPLHISAQL